MGVIVQKYGGSSVADIAKLQLVADQVAAARRAGHGVVVVVSAMGKATDDLLVLAQQAAARPDSDAAAEPARRELDMLLSTGERVSMALLSIAIQARGLDAAQLAVPRQEPGGRGRARGSTTGRRSARGREPGDDHAWHEYRGVDGRPSRAGRNGPARAARQRHVPRCRPDPAPGARLNGTEY